MGRQELCILFNNFLEVRNYFKIKSFFKKLCTPYAFNPDLFSNSRLTCQPTFDVSQHCKFNTFKAAVLILVSIQLLPIAQARNMGVT